MGLKQEFDEEEFQYPDSIDEDTQSLFEEAEKKIYKKFQRYSKSIKKSLH